MAFNKLYYQYNQCDENENYEEELYEDGTKPEKLTYGLFGENPMMLII